jgi:hypothetical protein
MATAAKSMGHTVRRRNSMCEALNYAHLDVKTELTLPQRYISFITSIAFDATLQASWEAVAVSFQAGLVNGGPVWIIEEPNVAWSKLDG